jgi:hypothetical protein
MIVAGLLSREVPAMRSAFSLPFILAALAAILPSGDAGAVPAFNRQTGQNCVACHAGGQFPELTAYGRLFKLTGYTIGERAMPLAGMAVANYTKTRDTSSADPALDAKANFPNDGRLVFDTASVFLAGKVTDNIGAFIQYTYGNYDTQDPVTSAWHGHSASDNLDVRFADRLVGPGSDFIYGVTANNNPTVSDPWNSAPAWGFNVVPGSAGPATTPIIAGGLAQNVAGAAAYAYWNRMLYGELGAYRTANGFWSFMSQGFSVGRGDMAIIRNGAPYGRLALTHDWGPHSAMLGVFGLRAKVYPDPTDPTGPTNDYRDAGVDGQYQYILDPHAVTVTASYISERITYADSVAGQPAPIDPEGALGLPLPNGSDTLHMFRAKASYVYGARYGGTLSFFNVTGSTNSMLQTSAFDPENPGAPIDGSQGVVGNASGNPATRGWTGEIFWQPLQYVRVGLQYTGFERFNGASNNYDAFGRNASANNAVFAYVWASY